MEKCLKKHKKSDMGHETSFLDVFSIKDILQVMILILSKDNFKDTEIRKVTDTKEDKIYIYTPANIMLILFGYSEIRTNMFTNNDINKLKILHCKYLCYNKKKSMLKYPYYKEYIYFIRKYINFGIFKNHEYFSKRNSAIILLNNQIKDEKNVNKKSKLINSKKILMNRDMDNLKMNFLQSLFSNFANTMGIKSNHGCYSDYDIKHFMNKYFNHYLQLEKNNSEFWNQLNQKIFNINVSYIFHSNIQLSHKYDVIRLIDKYFVRDKQRHLNINQLKILILYQIPSNFYQDIDIASKLFDFNIIKPNSSNENCYITSCLVNQYITSCLETGIIYNIFNLILKDTKWQCIVIKIKISKREHYQFNFALKENCIITNNTIQVDTELMQTIIPKEIYNRFIDYHNSYPGGCNISIDGSEVQLSRK